MSDFCLFYSNTTPVSDDRGRIVAGSVASPKRGVERIPGHPGFALVRSAESIETELFADDKYIVVVNGAPRWSAAVPAARARNVGFAQSLAEAFKASGTKVVDDLCGSFSIVIATANARQVFCCVDRMGIRPLTFSSTGDRLAVSTSALACARAAFDVPKVRIQSVFDYVFFHVIPSPKTIFEGVEKLAPAHSATLESGRFIPHRYWTPAFHSGTPGAGPSPSRDELMPCIEQAVEDSTLESLRTACFLSGGLDSSTMAGILARQHGGSTIDAYTVGFAQEGYDEMEFARTAAERFGLNLHELYISIDDVVDLTGKITSAFDEPFGNSSAIPSLFCSAAAKRDDVELMIAGDGGDELFGGNERYAKQKVFDIYRHIPSVLRRGLLDPVLGPSSPLAGVPLFSKAASYIEQANIPMPDRTQSYNFVRRAGVEKMFTKDFLSSVSFAKPYAALREEFNALQDAHLVDQMLFLDWKFILADNDLRKVGRTAQAAGVDVAYPLLENDVVDFSLRLPHSQKVRWLELRHYYKASLEDFLPSKIIHKTKHGFGLPFGEWLRTSDELSSLVNPAVENLVERGFLNAGFVTELRRLHAEEHASFYGNILWVLFMLESWLETHTSSENYA